MELSSQPAGWAHSVQPSFDLCRLEWFSKVTDCGQDFDLRHDLRLNYRSFSSSHQMGSGINSIFCRNLRIARLHLVLMLKHTCCFSFTHLSFLHGVVHSFRHKLCSNNEVFRFLLRKKRKPVLKVYNINILSTVLTFSKWFVCNFASLINFRFHFLHTRNQLSSRYFVSPFTLVGHEISFISFLSFSLFLSGFGVSA
jgi:hypothetical protein